MYHQSNVGDERPGCGRPGQEKSIFFIFSFELHENGRIFRFLVALGNFMAGKRRAATGAVGNDLVTFVDQPFFVEIVQYPPDSFDVIIFQCDVGIVQIDPITHFFGHFTPFFFVGKYGILTFFVKFFQSVFFDFFLIIQTKLFFHFDFHWQAVCVPTGFSFYLKAFHGFITANSIFLSAAEHVMNSRHAISCGRSFIEDELLGSFPEIFTLLNDIFFYPIFSDLFFQISGFFFHINCFIHFSLLPIQFSSAFSSNNSLYCSLSSGISETQFFQSSSAFSMSTHL